MCSMYLWSCVLAVVLPKKLWRQSLKSTGEGSAGLWYFLQAGSKNCSLHGTWREKSDICGSSFLSVVSGNVTFPDSDQYCAFLHTNHGVRGFINNHCFYLLSLLLNLIGRSLGWHEIQEINFSYNAVFLLLMLTLRTSNLNVIFFN